MNTVRMRLSGAMIVMLGLLSACGDGRGRPDHLFGIDSSSPTLALNLMANAAVPVPTHLFIEEGVPVQVRGSSVPVGAVLVVSARASNGEFDFFRYTRDVISEETVVAIRIWGNHEALETAQSVLIHARVRGLNGQTLAADSTTVTLR